MQTRELIEDLAAGAGRKNQGFVPPFWAVACLAPMLAAAVFWPALGPRADFAAALETVRFNMKFVETGLLAVTAYATLVALARPGQPWRHRALTILLPALLLASAVLMELALVPPDLWATRAAGSNALICLTAIPVIGAPVLALFLFALRRQAPTQPTLTGAVAGLGAAGIAAVFYAAHCTDDSPLFVALWYPLASLILVAAGALIGSKVLRW